MDGFTSPQLTLMLRLSLDAIERQRMMLESAQRRAEIPAELRAEVVSMRDELHGAELAAKAIQGELELTAEELGSASIATIRDDVRSLRARAERCEQAEAQLMAHTIGCEQTRTEYSNLYQAVWRMLDAHVTTAHRDGAGPAYWASRSELSAIMFDIKQSQRLPRVEIEEVTDEQPA